VEVLDEVLAVLLQKDHANEVRIVRKGKADIIIKDVCLLPSPRWKEVPRRQFKQELISRNLFIDAWSLDKSWSEQESRSELFNLIKDHLSGTSE
jgi:hypothetical protein